MVWSKVNAVEGMKNSQITNIFMVELTGFADELNVG